MEAYNVLRSLSAYPIPRAFLDGVIEARGLVLSPPDVPPLSDGEVVEVVDMVRLMNLAQADVYMWLAFAPDVSQGGISYRFDASQRLYFRKLANRLYLENGEPESVYKATFGYKGDRL